MTTTDLANFGNRELSILSEILDKYTNHDYFHPFWTDSEVRPMLNTYSGNVFLTDSDYNVLMLNGENLEPFYALPYSGDEGFYEDFVIDEYEGEDLEYLQTIKLYTEKQNIEIIKGKF